MLFRFFFAALWALLTTAQPVAAAPAADPWLLAQSSWEDPSAQASWEQARHQRYEAFHGPYSGGYGQAAAWLRLELAASAQPLVLRVLPPWLDSLTLYDDARPQAPPLTLGDRHPRAGAGVPGLGHAFELPPSAEPRVVWLRLQTTSARLVHVQLLPRDEAAAHGQRQLFWAGFYVSVLLLLGAVLLAVWCWRPERLLGLYLLRHAAYTAQGVTYLGLPAMLVTSVAPAAFDAMFSHLVIVVALVAVCFELAFLKPYRPHRWAIGGLQAIAAVLVLALLLLLLGHTAVALQINAKLVLAGSVLVLLAALSTPRSAPDAPPELPRSVLIVCYGVISLSLFWTVMGILDLLPVSPLSPYMLLLHGLVSSLMMSAVLLLRAQRTAWALRRAQQDARAERDQREQQSKFLHMLMHELKTPLAVVSAALGTQARREENTRLAQSAIGDMKAIIERCVQTDRLDATTPEPQREPVDVAALLRAAATQRPWSQRLRLKLPGLAPVVSTDAQWLRMVLANLLDNAHRYGDPLTPVTVRLERGTCPGTDSPAPGLRLRVSNIPGLAGWPDESQLFSRYYRAPGARRESGSGLGLYLSRQLARALGGELLYLPSSSEVEFVLWLPTSPT